MNFRKIHPFVFVFALLAFVLVARLALALKGYSTPKLDADEAVLVEPAVNYVLHGKMASPGLAPQYEHVGIYGLDRASFLYVPIPVYLRIGVMEIFGAGLEGRRIADWSFTLAVICAYALLAFRLFPRFPALLAVCVFAFSHNVIWWNAGRPDLISLAFGLLGFLVAVRVTGAFGGAKPGRFLGGALLGGWLTGLSGFSHQFGGVFWSFLIATLVVAACWKEMSPGRILLWLVVFGAGEFAAALLWLPQILANLPEFREQVLVTLKYKLQLEKNFLASAKILIVQALLLKPVVALGLVLLPFTKARDAKERRILRALCAMLGLLAIWRCRSFEYYNPNYNVHFLAAACLLFGFAATRVWAGVEKKFTGIKYEAVCYAALLVCIFLGREMAYKRLLDAFLVPNSPRTAEVAAALARNIHPGDRVIGDTTYYFGIDSQTKTLSIGNNNLDLSKYDVIVLSDRSIPAYAQEHDIFLDSFTRNQARQIRAEFTCVELLPGMPVKGVIFKELDGMGYPDLCIYRRKTPADATTPKPGE